MGKPPKRKSSPNASTAPAKKTIQKNTVEDDEMDDTNSIQETIDERTTVAGDIVKDSHLIPVLSCGSLQEKAYQCIDFLAKNRNINKGVLQTLKLVISSLAAKGEQACKQTEAIQELKELITSQSKPSFADILKAPAKSSATAAVYKHQQEEETVIVKPAEGKSIKEVEKQVRDTINKSGSNYKINFMKNTSRVLVIKTPKGKTDVNKLISELNNNNNISSQAKAYKPTARDPTILIKNLPADTDITTLAKTIATKNEELAGCEEEIKALFKVRSRYKYGAGFVNIAARVSPKVHRILVHEMNNCIYIDNQACYIENRIFIRQCQTCFSFGHRTTDCKETPICKACGKEKAPDHQCTGIRCCHNCRTSSTSQQGRSNRVSLDHFPNTMSCPIYAGHVSREYEQTAFCTPQIEHCHTQ